MNYCPLCQADLPPNHPMNQQHETITLMFDDAFEYKSWNINSKKELKNFMHKIYDLAQREIKGCEKCRLCEEHVNKVE